VAGFTVFTLANPLVDRVTSTCSAISRNPSKVLAQGIRAGLGKQNLPADQIHVAETDRPETHRSITIHCADA
jgi:hypothetical protein